MVINFKGKETELKFTFNSFKYMQDFDLAKLEQAETKPFVLASLIEILLVGALNSNPRIKVPEVAVQEFLETYAVDGDLSELMEKLVELLQESSFFKSLQKKN